MDTIEKDVQSIKEQTNPALQYQENKYQEMYSAVTNMPANVKLSIMEQNVEYLYTRMDTMSIKEQEKKHEELMETMSASSATHGVRLDTVKPGEETGHGTRENNSCVKEIPRKRRRVSTGLKLCKKAHKKRRSKTDVLKQPKHAMRKRRPDNKSLKQHKKAPRKRKRGSIDLKQSKNKRRPETDGLRKLKNRTEDMLDALKRLDYIPTKQAEKAMKLLEGRRSIVIKGNPGEGKTTTALHLIDNEMYRDRRVVLHYPQHCEKVDTDWVDIVVLEDVFGQFDLDLGCLQEWMVYLPTIQEHVDAGELEVIVTTRVDIMSKAYSMVRSLKLFSDDLSLTLSSEQLTYSEKMSILNRELHRHKRNMNEDEKEECIANFTGLIGFPQCCLLFAGDRKLFDRGPEFFRSPKEFFVTNITDLENAKFLSLAFLFCNDQIREEDLSSETMSESQKFLLMELAFHLQIPEKEASVTSVRDAYDSLLDLYVVKCMSYDVNFDTVYGPLCIMFTHATVHEAVGQVLGDRCVEMVVKYGDMHYLYQRTYIAETKDSTSNNVFIPVSVYGILAERIVCDVRRKLTRSIVKHSAFKKHEFLMKLKDEVCKGTNIKDLFIAESFLLEEEEFEDDLGFDDETHPLSKGECETFMQYMLQNDEDVVTLVYSHFLEFLTCAHANDSPDCWQCEEKQTLLELALYYHHFEIADKLITMNAYYTHVSLCNAARHGDLLRVSTILETLKSSQVFNPECKEAKDALCRAFKSGNQSLIEILLKEGIILDSMHVLDAVQHGNLDVLMRVVEHLKSHKKWKPQMEQHWKDIEPCFFSQPSEYSEVELKIPSTKALYIAYHNEKFDMADYLLNNGVNVSVYMLAYVTQHSSWRAAARVIQNLKDTGSWNPYSDDIFETLENAYSFQRYDFCDLLVQEGVPPRMENLLHVTTEFPLLLKPVRPVVQLETVKKVIQHLKDTDNWDPKCDYACTALKNAYIWQKYDVCDLLVQEGVSLIMKNFHDVVSNVSIESVKKAIQHMKDTDDWDPKCKEASEALTEAYKEEKTDVCDLLAQEGVSLKMKNFFLMVLKVSKLETIKKAIQHMKNTDNWDPKCPDASSALATAYKVEKYDVCDLLGQEGVSLKMNNLPSVVMYSVSFEHIKKQIQHLKDTNNWDPMCDDASKALANAYISQMYNVCNLLEQDGVSLKMEHFSDVISRSSVMSHAIMQCVKDPDNWGPRCYGLTFECYEKLVQHLKDTNNWDPKCDDASEALKIAYDQKMFCFCYLLVCEGMYLKLKNLPDVINSVSLRYYDQAIQHMKGSDYQKPNFYQLTFSYFEEEIPPLKDTDYDVCFLLDLEGVSLTMKNLHEVKNSISIQYYKKAIQHLKDTNNWDPKCDDASQALIDAYSHNMDNVRHMLIQEGVTLKMKNLLDVVFSKKSETIRNVIEHLEDTDNWDPKCDEISEALAHAYSKELYDLCDLLVQKGVTLAMKNLPVVTVEFHLTLKSVKKAIQLLKNSKNWDPKCDDASQALENAYCQQKYDLCDLLVQEEVSLKMKNLPYVVARVSIEYLKKAIQQMKDNDNWKPKCDDASEALVFAYDEQMYDVCDLLVLEGVSLAMKNLPALTVGLDSPLKSIKKAIQHLKDTGNWDPKCDDASQALANAYSQKYNVCDLLVMEGVSLKMKNLPDMVYSISFEYFKRALKHMKDTGNWDDEYKVLANCVSVLRELNKWHIQDEERATLGLRLTLKSVKKAIQHLKVTGNWDPECDVASEALANAYSQQDDNLCDLLVREGILLTMKNLSDMVYSISFKYFKKAVQHLKDTGYWDPKCDDASQLLVNAYSEQKYDVCDLLVHEGVTRTMKNPSFAVYSVPVVKKVKQHLKKTGKLSMMLYYVHVIKLEHNF